MRAIIRCIRRASSWCREICHLIYAIAALVVIALFGSDLLDEPPDDDYHALARLDADYDPPRAVPEPAPAEIDKGLTDNRDRYIAQSAATRDGIVADLDQAA